jgi:hypothetical protein
MNAPMESIALKSCTNKIEELNLKLFK